MKAEELLQTMCVNWFKTNFPQFARVLIHVANERKCGIHRGALLRGMGVTAGVADLILFVARRGYHGLCIELKTPTGRQRDTQQDWQAAVEGQGYKYIIVRDFRDFCDEINNYLEE